MHELAAQIEGVVLEPSDPGFAAEVAGFNAAVSHTPTLVVGAASAADVVAAVRYAAEHSLPVRVQATGHGAHVAVADGLLITTTRMDAVTVDPRRRVATVQAGARWAAVVAAASPHGLAPITGSAASVGVVGYLLGGGLGPLARSHGFSSDRLLAATVVTADGDIVDASPTGDAELFWALRGGKGGLGVVTEIRVGLVDLPQLYAGSLTFDGAHAEAVLRGWIDWSASAPDDVTTSVALMRFPDLDVVPAEVRGRFVVALRLAYPGAAADGERLAAPLRALAPVEIDALDALPIADVARIHGDPSGPLPSWGWGALLTPLDQEFASTLTSLFHPSAPLPFLGIELRHLGGAVALDVEGGSAVGGREGAFAIHVLGAPDPSLFAEVLPRAAAGFAEAIRAWIAPATNIHWISHLPEAVEFASAWPEATFTRLAEVRRRVDPAGVFAYGPHA
ncbi:FAD-binding oxidoreductase [Pseudolysinimonas sp.]|jgi:FAD/FMN-containing dehydrogenase|uniref:FAD-binding oxidoreductase n=1 Tax=Pseudolysinimonas sp. TaxID=2680009 RepID=UPI0037833C5D